MTGPPQAARRDEAAPRGLGASRGYLLLAALALAAVPLGWWWLSSGPEPMPPTPAPAAPRTPDTTLVLQAADPPGSAAPAPATAMPPPPTHARNSADVLPPFTAARPVRGPQGDPTPDLADVLNPGEVPTMAEVIARLNAAGVTSGLGAFQPPGTRPPLIGLAVPVDFELPPGYVRHHQATDDGQRIEAILMFAPDAQLIDAQGRPLPLPANRVVPPELAPPGLPIRTIVLPAPLAPGR